MGASASAAPCTRPRRYARRRRQGAKFCDLQWAADELLMRYAEGPFGLSRLAIEGRERQSWARIACPSVMSAGIQGLGLIGIVKKDETSPKRTAGSSGGRTGDCRWGPSGGILKPSTSSAAILRARRYAYE